MPHTLYQRGKIWHFRGTVSGRRFRGSTKASDKTIAERIAAEREAKEWKRHLDGPEATLTFAQACVYYTAAGKPGRYLPPLIAHFKDTLVRNMPHGLIREAAKKLYPHVSGATLNRSVVIPVSAVINHNAEAGRCSKINVPRFETTTKVKTPIDLAWVEAFMKVAPPHLGALALFMFTTGARVSEALAVEWDDVDLNRRIVKIDATKVGKEREAHLPHDLVVALSNLKRPPGATVFRYADRNSANKEWRKAAVKAKIPVLSFHCCRHGFATSLLRAGVDPITVAKRGGWSTPEHVFRTYGHPSDDHTITDLLVKRPLAQNVINEDHATDKPLIKLVK